MPQPWRNLHHHLHHGHFYIGNAIPDIINGHIDTEYEARRKRPITLESEPAKPAQEQAPTSPDKIARSQPQAATPRNNPIKQPIKQGIILPIPLKFEDWTGTASELAALAREIYTQDLQGTSVENASPGAQIAFTSEGKNEAFGAKGRLRSPVRAELVKVLDKLAESAVKVSEAAPAKGRESDTKTFHTLVNVLEVGG